MRPTEDRLAALAKALAHPARIRILRLLQAAPGCVGGTIVDKMGLAQSTVSEHLRIMKAANLITGEIDGARTCYALAPQTLAPLSEFISGLEASAEGACCVTAEECRT